jgi:predicted CopG family antitoxin
VIEHVASQNRPPDEGDPLAPQREAAMFYGLFLRGHSAEALRRDIELPREVLDRLTKRKTSEDSFRQSIERVYHYRRKVLAIFDELILNERTRLRLQ